ncbi:hypothetical protein [Lederbergia lenta]|uniref:hypothetical protein n=1 Tax=Lederbergia lenta TaxID=1467 RepID=UPI00203C2E1E|nr:hypothetical protein [Lederbergia lenta]MCM3110021.1 hypothetical protein [Lederbergia lenta]
MRLGSDYIGSEALEVSVANKDIIQETSKRYNLYKFSFINDSDCTVVVNDKARLFLRANQGFSIDEVDSPIWSFKVVEDGIQYNWLGAY